MIATVRALPVEQRGILLFCLITFIFSLMDITAKHLTQTYPPAQVVWARYASQFFWSMLILSPKLRTYLRTRHLGLQLIRSACLFGATFCFFTALKYLKFAEATAIFEVAPLVITILSVIILKEQVGRRRWTGVIVGFLGALVIIRPGTDVFSPVALLPMLSATCFAGYTIATRFLGQDEPHATSFLYTTLIGTIVATLFLPFYWKTPTLVDGLMLGTFGVIGAAGHFLLIIALSFTRASTLAPFGYLALLWNALWGLMIFSEVPDAYTWIGAAIIVGAGLYVWHRERVA